MPKTHQKAPPNSTTPADIAPSPPRPTGLGIAPVYRPDIDGLRAIAVMAVLLHHAGLGLRGGYVGVDVFFVISGYLIAGLILADLDRGTFSLVAFWERRVRRIAPALFVVTAVTSVAAWFILLPDDFARYGRSLAALSVMASNVHFWRDTNYFADAAEHRPLLHTWSLSVEEQFYLGVPLFLLLLAKSSRSRQANVVLAVATLSLGFSLYGTRHYPTANFYLLPGRAWELLAGALLLFVPPAEKTRVWVRQASAVLGLALVLVPCVVYGSNTPFPGLAAIPPVMGAALLIRSGTPTGRLPAVSRLLGSPPLVFVGLISYSLYLWHWPLFSFIKYRSIEAVPAIDWVLLVAVSMICGTLSWYFVERPFRRRQLLPSRVRLFSATALVVSVFLAFGIALDRDRGVPARISKQTQALISTGQLDHRYVRNLEEGDIPDHLIRLGSHDRPAELVIWGDSHAMAVLPAIDALCRRYKTSALAITHFTTPPLIDFSHKNNWGLNEKSISFNAAAVQYILRARVKAVLLVAYWRMYADTPGYEQAIVRTASMLRSHGVDVYFMKSVPTYDFNVHRALVLLSHDLQPMSSLGLRRSAYENADKLSGSLLREFKALGVRVLDPAAALKTASRSLFFVPYDAEGSFYFDAYHLSVHGALALMPLFEPIVRSMTHASGGSSELSPGPGTSDKPPIGAGSAAETPME